VGGCGPGATPCPGAGTGAGAALCVRPAQSAAPPASQEVPDEEFIEFLGEDDHGDAAWSEFLKRAQHGAQNPAPQGTKES
jgi:hypothetical protein